MMRGLRSSRGLSGTLLRLAGLMALLLLVVTDPSMVVAKDAAPGGAGSAAPGPVVPAGRQASKLAVITISTPISSVTSRSFERRLRLAEKGGMDGVVVELNTPGGEVGAVLEITSMIRSSTVPLIIAWVNEDAFSGGAIIALACDEIVVSAHATMGDAAPIQLARLMMGQGMPQTERVKVLMPILADLTESARAAGYDENLVQAMVVLGVETWAVEHRETGRRYFLTEAEYKCLFGEAPERGRARTGLMGAPQPDEYVSQPGSGPKPSDPDDFRPASKELGAMSAEDYDALNMSISEQSRRPDFCRERASDYVYLEQATDGTTLLTMGHDDLVDFGFASGTVGSDAELEAFLGASTLHRLDENWSERVFGPVISSWWWPLLRIVCVIVFLIALFVEMSVPGMGIPGIIALLALGVVLVPPVLVNAALWWTFFAVILGVLLILLEIFVFPGFGVPGIAGMVCLLAGLIGSFASMGAVIPGTGGDTSNVAWATSIVLVAMFIAGLGMYFFSRYTHSFPVAGQMILSTRSGDSSEGMLAAMSPAPVSSSVQVGDVGRVTSTLRPSGTAEINERLLDVVSESGFIEPGATVRVTSVGTYRVTVELVEEASPPSPRREDVT
ncbi:MAG: hypothetical protein KDA21_05135 [Phycisphaerales bacterium]|nr:hypothetical protein [Phycisphaerales bacterium]